MMLRKLILTTAAAAMAVTPLAAQAAPARVSSPVAEAEGIGQEALVLLLVAGFALLVLVFGDNSSEQPTSP